MATAYGQYNSGKENFLSITTKEIRKNMTLYMIDEYKWLPERERE
jgi:hypothetical protein